MRASPISCCSLFLESVATKPDGGSHVGFATGFLYAGPRATRWLVTNWHVVTGRRPDNPGMLVGERPQSPYLLRFKVNDPVSSRFQEMEVQLYDSEGPTWIERRRVLGVDLAMIRLNATPTFALPTVQNFAPNYSGKVMPGLDVVIVGHPFPLGEYAPSAIWKGATVASDYEDFDEKPPWILVDAPGTPGMSGSPVYRRVPSYAQLNRERDEAQLNLELIGVYAGATGDKKLETLRLGRVFPIGLVENLLSQGGRGDNPFPPQP
jgi:Trypsin-like peptidase domain